MTREKFDKLRKKRLKEGMLARERYRRLREKKKERWELTWKRVVIKKAEAEKKGRLEEKLLRKKRLEEEEREKARLKALRKIEEETQEKARDAIKSVKATVKEVEEKTKASVYVPELTTEISGMLADADESFRSADYEKTIKLSLEIKELAEKARLEASVRAEEKKKAEEERKRAEEEERRKRIEEQLLLEKKLEEERQGAARNALMSVKTALEEAEEKTKLSIYVPETIKKIDELLTDAQKSFDSADYEKAVKLSYEIGELLEEASSEASRKAEEKRRRRKEQAKYFYCVIPFSEEKTFGNIGMNKNEIYTIPYRDIAAVVSDSPMKDYELTEDNTRMHEEVVRQIMEAHTVVPVEFGTTIKNERILRQLMSKAYNPVRECLKLVDNKVELGVKALLGKDIVYFDREKGKESVFDILESLKNKASEVREGDLFSDRLFLNSSFLVEKDGIDEFSNEVTRLQEKYSMFKMLYSGPWAPYSFVYIKIGGEGLTIAKDKGRGAR